MNTDLLSILLLQSGYNTNLVLLGTLVLGGTSGLIGCFLNLRGKPLVSDAISHATLPGIGLGFLLAYYLGLESDQRLPLLLAGGAFSGALSALCIQFIHARTRLTQDAAIASILGTFYGGGIVLLSIIQRLENAGQAGLDTILLGQATGLSFNDFTVIATLCIGVILLCLLFFRDLSLLCFDTTLARTLGKPVSQIDMLLTGLAVIVVCMGLKTVGIILILALLIIPPLTARLWTDNLPRMLLISSILGALISYMGTALSASFDHLPTGATIVLCAAGIFTISLIVSPKRGLFALHHKGPFNAS